VVYPLSIFFLIKELLIQYGIDFTKEDNYGLTPLYLAKSKGHEGEAVFRYLLGEGAPYNDITAIDVRKVEAEIASKMAKVEEQEGNTTQ
jgi:hypothetical protein